jgi:hypothetical protein
MFDPVGKDRPLGGALRRLGSAELRTEIIADENVGKDRPLCGALRQTIRGFEMKITWVVEKARPLLRALRLQIFWMK